MCVQKNVFMIAVFLALLASVWAKDDTMGYGSIMTSVKVNGQQGRMFNLNTTNAQIDYEYQLWGSSNAIVFSVLLFIDQNDVVNIVKVSPLGTGNGFPGKMHRESANAQLPAGINIFFLFLAPVYNANEATKLAKQFFDGKTKHFGCAFTVVKGQR